MFPNSFLKSPLLRINLKTVLELQKMQYAVRMHLISIQLQYHISQYNNSHPYEKNQKTLHLSQLEWFSNIDYNINIIYPNHLNSDQLHNQQDQIP